MGKGVHRCGRIGLGPSPFCAYIGSVRDGLVYTIWIVVGAGIWRT